MTQSSDNATSKSTRGAFEPLFSSIKPLAELIDLPSGPADFLAVSERRRISSCPLGRVHAWIFNILCLLSKYYSDDNRLFEATRAICERFALRHVPDGEILRQIGNARRYGTSGSGNIRNLSGLDQRPRWPLPDIAAIESIVRAGPRIAQLQGALPACHGHGLVRCHEILQRLFSDNPLLCCGKELWSPKTLKLSQLDRLDECQFVVPSPMTKTHGLTKDGKESPRSLDNTGPRQFLVIEFDFKADDANGSFALRSKGGADQRMSASAKPRLVSRLLNDGFTVLDICAALIHHLASYVSPALVVYSGGKSLHAWFPCMGVHESRLEQFMRYAIQIGADPATWCRCQFVRMPGGRRDNGNLQIVHYFNPEALS